MDGVRFDPLHRHIVDKKWTAVMVEPLLDMFALLQQNYAGHDHVRCVNVAISDTTGPLRLFRVKPELVIAHGQEDWILGISSALKGPTLSYLENIVTEEVVRGVSFDDFVDECQIQRIDVLQIDTEGYDWNVLRQVDLMKWNISVINVEVINLQPPERLKVFERLKNAGYEYNYEGMDVTAVLGSGR
jgi:FkbM family methyltransferase